MVRFTTGTVKAVVNGILRLDVIKATMFCWMAGIHEVFRESLLDL